MVVVMDLSDESTWPSDLLAYLERHRDLFRAWEEQSQGSPSTVSARDYDQALLGLRPVLNNHALHGYH